MAKLQIGNQTVTVDDAFLSMPPDQQQATVDEIAASLGGGQGQSGYDAQSVGAGAPIANVPQPFANAAPVNPRGTIPPMPPANYGEALSGSTAATLSGIVNGIPVIGPMAQNATDAIIGTGMQLAGQGTMQEYRDRAQAGRRAVAAQYPVANIAGNIAGGVGSVGVGGLSATGANALGMTGKLGQQMINSSLSTLGLMTADNMVRGDKPMDALAGAVGPSLLSGAVPAAGELLKRGGEAVYNGAIKPIMTAANRENEAIGRIGKAIEMGRNNPMAPAMSQADEAVARQAGVPVINADRGGAPLRTLARTAANVSPEASASLNATVSDRFETQAPRAIGFVRQLMNGATDDLALQDGLRVAARNANKPAYEAAYNAPNARAIWTPEIGNLMQAGPFRAAVNAAEDTATNAAAVGGGNAVRNPFVFNPDGTATLRTMPDGSRALPNLQFWDIVQRNLRNTAEMADRSGDKLLASQTRAMRDQLVSQLDSAVPQFGKARAGAASFFGAEDAIDAGRKFATQPKTIPEATKAFSAMKPAEKDAFAIGYASELVDTIKASRDRVNVINQVFGSQARREMNALALGPQKARELEAYVRVEQIVQSLKDAVGGNSTTAQQLIASGVIGGAGGFLATGDMTGAFTGASLLAAGRRGMQMMGKRVDEQVMARIGEILASGDEALLQKAIQNASLSAEHRLALEAIQTGLEAITKGAIVGSTAAAKPNAPLRITVQGANPTMEARY